MTTTICIENPGVTIYDVECSKHDSSIEILVLIKRR